MLENIILVPQIHEKLSYKQAQEKAFIALKCLGISHIAHYRYTSCNAQEKFYAQLIRANMFKDTKIIIEQPFHLLDKHVSIDFIFSALKHLNIDITRIHILDLEHMKTHYEGSLCLIKKS